MSAVVSSAVIIFRHLSLRRWPAGEAGPAAVTVAEVKSWRDVVRVAVAVGSGETSACLGLETQPTRSVVIASPPDTVVPSLLFPSSMQGIPWMKVTNPGVLTTCDWDALVVWPVEMLFPRKEVTAAAHQLLQTHTGGGAIVAGVELVPPRESRPEAAEAEPGDPVVVLMREARRIIAVCHHSKRIPTADEMVRLRQIEFEIAELRRASGQGEQSP